MRPQGEGGGPQAGERGLRRNQPCRTVSLDSGLRHPEQVHFCGSAHPSAALCRCLLANARSGDHGDAGALFAAVSSLQSAPTCASGLPPPPDGAFVVGAGVLLPDSRQSPQRPGQLLSQEMPSLFIWGSKLCYVGWCKK